MPTEAQLGYVAGILDGEGSISLSRSKDKRYYFSQVRIFNTDLRILEAVQEYMGSNIVIHNDHSKVDTWKTCYRIEINAHSKIKEFLLQVLPYLVGKREKALVMLAFCEDTSNKEFYWELLHILNKKGGNNASS